MDRGGWRAAGQTVPKSQTQLSNWAAAVAGKHLPPIYGRCLQLGRPGFDPWVRKIPWRRKWQPTPVFLPGKSHGQRSLVGYSPWGRKESDTAERVTQHNNNSTKSGKGHGFFVLFCFLLMAKGIHIHYRKLRKNRTSKHPTTQRLNC